MHVLIAVGLRIILVDYCHYEDAYVLLPLFILAGMIGSTMIYNWCKHIGLGCIFEYDPEVTMKILKIFMCRAENQKG